ncbi:MAG: hypothetical protein GY802_14675, partial [Gammaproteobacteria bacterium]|nr:hypothetical protein [Gammaproteobacteria bacterium]
RIPSLDKPGKRELAQQLCAQHNAVLVETIGSIIVIYRPNEETNRFAAIIGA